MIISCEISFKWNQPKQIFYWFLSEKLKLCALDQQSFKQLHAAYMYSESQFQN